MLKAMDKSINGYGYVFYVAGFEKNFVRKVSGHFW